MAKVKDRKRVSDYWTRKARQEKYPARSVYKLKDINKKHRLIKGGSRVLDLGAAPGAWMKYSAETVGANGLVVGLDLNPLEISLSPNMVFQQADVTSVSPESLIEGGLFDAVVSDMAPKTTGVKFTDQSASEYLARSAFELAVSVLKTGGSFLVKIFEGPDVAEFVKDVRPMFEKISRIKPESSRKMSPEFFILGLKFKKGNI